MEGGGKIPDPGAAVVAPVAFDARLTSEWTGLGCAFEPLFGATTDAKRKRTFK